MHLLKKLFGLSPLKVSVLIALLFALISAIYDINPKLITLISTLSEKSIDYKFKLRGPQPPKSKIVIVAGDEKAFHTFGQWPFDRGTVFAPLFEKLCSYGPQAVGLDIVWADRERSVTSAVRQTLATELKVAPARLDELLEKTSNDARLRNALESCQGRMVLGYSLDYSAAPETGQAEYAERLKLLTQQGQNALNSVSRGKIRFGRFRGDPESNIDYYRIAKSGVLNLPSVTPPQAAQGFFNNEQDGDGNYRHAFLFFRAEDSFVPSLTLRMAQKTLTETDAPPTVFIQPNDPDRELEQDLRMELQTAQGPVEVPMDLSGQVTVNYRGPNLTYPNISMADLLDDSDTVGFEQFNPASGKVEKFQRAKAELFKDANVLVGITALGLYDIRPRPLAPQASGVENHANILDNLLNGDFLVRPTTDWLVITLILVFIGSILYGLAIARLNALWGTLFATGTIGALLYLDQALLFNQRGIVFASHLQAAQLLLQFLAITVLKYMREEDEKRFIRSAFDKYVSPKIIDNMLADPTRLKLGGEKKELSVLFSDIRGFTQLSEKVDVKALTQFLNEYLGGMTDILQGNSGTLDKYIGDAIMGFWGAPVDLKNHAQLAVKTAVEMVGRLDELNADFQKKYGFAIDIGIGINSGPVSVGNFGSSRVFSYTVIGDNVNLASRLEGLNKYYGTRIVVSETTYQALEAGSFLSREIDTVRVKGKARSVKIYEIFPDNAAHQPLKNALQSFNEGLTSYYARQWDKAVSLFQSVLQIRSGDRPALELIERCRHYMSNPPSQGWDGSWEMRTK